MILSVHQPQYLPWLGYFDKLQKSDCFVFLDQVQYKPREFQNRNKVRTKDGWRWLSVPVITKGKGRQRISEVMVDNSFPWQRKHLGSLKTWYGQANFFKDHLPFFEQIYAKSWERLLDLNVYIINYILMQLQISKPMYFESELGITHKGTFRIIEICQSLNADTYLSGIGGMVYLEEEQFGANGIKLVYQDFKHPEYRQRYEPFIPFMSIIDLLFNHGEESIKILTGKV